MSVRPARQKKPIKIAALILVPLAFAWALGAAQAFAKDTALDKAEALSQAFADAFEKVKPSIVNLRVVRAGGRDLSAEEIKTRGYGSGFVLDKEGRIIVSNHVVDRAERVQVRFADGRSGMAAVAGSDALTDLAVLKMENAGPFVPAVLADSDKLRPGEWVIAIGNPYGLENSLSAGVVSGTNRLLGESPYASYIQTDAAINPGNSGGPLVNLKGEVVGVCAMTSAEGQRIGFAISSNLVGHIAAQIKENGRVVRGWLGVSVSAVEIEMEQTPSGGPTFGLLVKQVSESGPAGRAGIKVGDVIYDYDGTTVRQPAQLYLLVMDTEIGRKVKMQVLQKGERKTISVIIMDRKESSQ